MIKYCVWTFLKTILDRLMSGNKSLKKTHIFSDGHTSQFKNKYVLSSVVRLQTLYVIKFSWTFFATSHGKGAVYALSGIVKRGVLTKLYF